jgi:hypothetical protein
MRFADMGGDEQSQPIFNRPADAANELESSENERHQVYSFKDYTQSHASL